MSSPSERKDLTGSVGTDDQDDQNPGSARPPSEAPDSGPNVQSVYINDGDNKSTLELLRTLRAKLDSDE